jgi:hypothetical protein
VVHSLFFFTKKELYSLNPDVSETNRIAKQLLNRLLIMPDETPKKEIQTA